MKNFSILFFVSISYSLGMENEISSPKKIYKVITSDNITDTIVQEHLDICNVIRNMLQDCPNENNSLPLPIESQILPVLKDCLENSYIIQNKQESKDSRKAARKKLNQELNTPRNLHAMLLFANELDASHLLKYCMKLWAKAKYDPEKYPLPDEINIRIARYMEKSQQLLDKTAEWVAKEQKNNMLKKNLMTQSSVWSTAISNNGEFIVSGHANGLISIYNIKTNLFESIHSGYRTCSMIQFNNNNKEVWSSGQDGRIKIWNLSTKENTKTIESDLCYGFVFRHIPQYNIMITDSKNHKICLWNLGSNNSQPEILNTYLGCLVALESTHDGSLFASASDCSACIWNTATKELITTFKQNNTDVGVMSVHFNYAKNKFLCGLSDGKIVLYDLVTQQKLCDKKEHTKGIWSVLFSNSKDTLFYSGSKDKTIKLWDIRTYKNIKTLSDHSDYIHNMAINSPKRLLVSASLDKTIKVWDLRKLLVPIYKLRKDLFNNCVIEDMLTLEKSTDTSLQPNNPLLKKFSNTTQQFLLDNQNIQD